jgi:hypothetical protein
MREREREREREEFGVYTVYLHDAPSSDNNFGDARIGPLFGILRYRSWSVVCEEEDTYTHIHM